MTTARLVLRVPSTTPAIALAFAIGLPAALAQTKSTEAEGTAFFENRIRPVLVKHCYSCHSEDAKTNRKLKAHLFLDSRDGMLRGGDGGPVIAAGKSKESLLLHSLRGESRQMPPAGKLPDAVVADFAKWVDMGAPDPRHGKAAPTVAKREIDVAAGRQFWSFRPLQKVEPPTVGDAAWSKVSIDRFIRAAQVGKGVRPNGPASKEKLIRRAYYDLIGLPPTPEQIDAFRADNSPDAFARVIDSLLDSPQYGERWGRHWLDVVRFAESGGYEFDAFRAGAYHYRDWVIRAFNADMPYDEFIRRQVAGDKLAPGTYEGAAATGFLVAGPYPGQTTAKTLEKIRYDQIDDMVSTIGSSVLGLTLACVRCHEHKYDPIPQRDYYGIASVLSRTAHAELPFDPEPEATRRSQAEHKGKLDAAVAELRRFEQTDFPARFARWSSTEAAKAPATARWQWFDVREAEAERFVLTAVGDGVVTARAEKSSRDGRRKVSADGYTVVTVTHQKGLTAFRLELSAEKSLPKNGPGLGPDGDFRLTDVKVTARPLDARSTAKPTALKLKPVAATFENAKHTFKNALDEKADTGWSVGGAIGKDHSAVIAVEGGVPSFEGGTELTFELRFNNNPGIGRFRLAFTVEPAPTTADGAADHQHLREIRAMLDAGKGPSTDAARPEMVRWFRRFDAPADKVFGAVEALQRTTPRPKLSNVYTSGGSGGDVYFLRRGEVDGKQGKVDPGFVQVLNTAAEGDARWLPKAPPGGKAPDPRIALGAWLTDAERGAGPLTARVVVNRVWQHHFGRGIVGTPNDFGAQGERPSHPELLEWLAAELVRNGWRLKPLHRLIMNSAVYRQAGEVSADNLRLDPDNRLLWHRRPLRLEAEVIRDALWAVGGELDLRQFGPGDLNDENRRRSVYLSVKRSQLIPFLQMFDAPEPTQSIGERSSTTVPTQALAMMNSPLVRKRAEALARRARPAATEPLSAAVDRAYTIALSRGPTPREREMLSAFIAEQKSADAKKDEDVALVEVCHMLLCLSEFVYVD